MTTTLTSQRRKVLEDTTALVRFQLIDENGEPIDPIVLDSLVLTLYVKGAANVKINGRDDQDVFNANDVTVQAPVAIADATQTNPVVITAVDHQLRSGDVVKISGVVGMTELNDRLFTVTRISDDTFSLQGENGVNHSAYVSSGTVDTGLVTWEVQPDDNVIVGILDAKEIEEHVALFEWTYDTTKQGKVEIQVDVEQLDNVS